MPLDFVAFSQATSTSGTATTMSIVDTGNDKIRKGFGPAAIVNGMAVGVDLATAEEIAEGDYAAISGPRSLGGETAYFNINACFNSEIPPKVMIPCIPGEKLAATMLQTTGAANLTLYLGLTVNYAQGMKTVKKGHKFKSVFIRKTDAASADLSANTWGTVNAIGDDVLQPDTDYAVIAAAVAGENDGTAAAFRLKHGNFGDLKPGAMTLINRWTEGAANYGGINWHNFLEVEGEAPVFNSASDLTMEAISQAAQKPVGWLLLGEV